MDLGLSVALHFSNNQMATFVTDLRVIMMMIMMFLGILIYDDFDNHNYHDDRDYDDSFLQQSDGHLCH